MRAAGGTSQCKNRDEGEAAVEGGHVVGTHGGYLWAGVVQRSAKQRGESRQHGRGARPLRGLCADVRDHAPRGRRIYSAQESRIRGACTVSYIRLSRLGARTVVYKIVMTVDTFFVLLPF